MGAWLDFILMVVYSFQKDRFKALPPGCFCIRTHRTRTTYYLKWPLFSWGAVFFH